MTLFFFHPIALLFGLLLLALRPMSLFALLLHPFSFVLWILFIATWLHLKSLNWMIR